MGPDVQPPNLTMNAQNEKPKEPEIKVTVKASLSWGMIWLAGILFTLGFAPYPAGLSLWQQAGKWFLYVFVWPLILGQKLGG
jgi:hypothetical protein